MIKLSYYPTRDVVLKTLVQQRDNSKFQLGEKCHWVPRQAGFELSSPWCETVTLVDVNGSSSGPVQGGLYGLCKDGAIRTVYANELLKTNHPILRRPPEPRKFGILPGDFMGGAFQVLEPTPLLV